eukprot:UN10214
MAIANYLWRLRIT